MSNETLLTQRLRRAVLSDLTPVRPLPAPWIRTLLIAPIALVLLIGIPSYFGMRRDIGWRFSALSGLSLLEVMAGLWLVGAALREAVPGRHLSKGSLVGLTLAGGFVFLAVTLLTAQEGITRIPEAWVRYVSTVCLGTPVILGVPLLALVSFLALRAFPLRPAVVGMLSGLGSGLLVDSGWRLYCHFADPSHVLLTHGGAIVLLGLSGAMLGKHFASRRQSLL